MPPRKNPKGKTPPTALPPLQGVMQPPPAAPQPPAPAPPAQPPQPEIAEAGASLPASPSRTANEQREKNDDTTRQPPITARAGQQQPPRAAPQPPQQLPRAAGARSPNRGTRVPDVLQQKTFLQAAAGAPEPQRAIITTRNGQLKALSLTGPRYAKDQLRALGPLLDDTIEQLEMLNDSIGNYCLNDAGETASAIIPSMIKDTAACLA